MRYLHVVRPANLGHCTVLKHSNQIWWEHKRDWGMHADWKYTRNNRPWRFEVQVSVNIGVGFLCNMNLCSQTTLWDECFQMKVMFVLICFPFVFLSLCSCSKCLRGEWTCTDEDCPNGGMYLLFIYSVLNVNYFMSLEDLVTTCLTFAALSTYCQTC